MRSNVRPWSRGSNERALDATRFPWNSRDVGRGPEPGHGHALNGIVHYRLGASQKENGQSAPLARFWGHGRNDSVFLPHLPVSTIWGSVVCGAARIRRTHTVRISSLLSI